MIDKIKSLLLNRLFIGYALIGITGVALDVISYIFFINSGIAPVLAAILSTSLGIINNFLLNSFYNFRKRDRMIIRFIKFYGVGLVGILLTATLIYILHDKIGIGPLVAKLMTIPPVVLIQFLLVYSYLALTSVKGYTKGWYGGQSLSYLGVASIGSISS